MPHAPLVSEEGVHYAETFSKEQAQTHMKVFADHVREKNTLVAIALVREISLRENFGIEIPISSSVELEWIEKVIPSLRKFLRGRLKNDKVEIYTKMQEIETPIVRLVPVASAWDELVAKYPLLEELKNKLNLEIE